MKARISLVGYEGYISDGRGCISPSWNRHVFHVQMHRSVGRGKWPHGTDIAAPRRVRRDGAGTDVTGLDPLSLGSRREYAVVGV